MARPRLTIGTFGDITTRTMSSGRFEARTRYRDWDGCSRIVQATGDTAKGAERALKDKLTERGQSRDVAVAVRCTKAQVRQEERKRQFSHLVGALVTHIGRHADRLSEEARFENRARRRRGRPGASLEWMVVQLATQEVLEVVATDRLTVEDARRAGRIARSSIDAPAHGLSSPPRERGLRAPAR